VSFDPVIRDALADTLNFRGALEPRYSELKRRRLTFARCELTR